MAEFSIQDDIAVVEINNGPVNALSIWLRADISKRIQEANLNPAVKAIVICGKGRTFPAGADIKEFEATRQKREKYTGPQVDSVIENSEKPVIAAIHGTCLGGGLEIAISAHFRIAVSSAKFGFPEVLLGIIPGLGGTQRLPRLVGMQKALDIIVSGSPIKANEALDAGLINKVVQSTDIKEAGITFAREVLSEGMAKKITSQLPIPDAAFCKQIVDGTLDLIQKKLKGLKAPVNCVRAVEASVKSSTFEEGMKRERELIEELFISDQAKCLQYAFFAEKAAQKWDLPNGPNLTTVKPKRLKTGAVIGAGTMGSGIAMCMLNANIPVYLVEQNEEMLNRGEATIRSLYEGSVKLGRMSQEEADRCLSLLTPTLTYEDLASADIIVEAVFENMELKKKVFTQIEGVCKDDALLCSNTSSLNIDQIASATSCPDRVIGTHFFSPAYYMKLLEIVRGCKTSPLTIASAFAYGKMIGKVPVLVGNCHGFVGNRMMTPYVHEARFVVEEGALPQQVDQVIEDYGFALGPFKVGDLAGLDIGWNITKERCKSLGIPYESRRRSFQGARYCPLLDMLCEVGRFGRKTGAGWYRYEKPGAKKPMVDEFVTDMIEKFCREEGIQRRQIEKEEITERCLYCLINEGFKIMDEGIATKAEDIDTIWNLGYAWPRQTGGPMYVASNVGLRNIYDKICHYYKTYPTTTHWKPSALLQRLATNAPDAPMSTWRNYSSQL